MIRFPIGQRIGVNIGSKLAVGSAPAPDPMLGVDRDATSGIYCPGSLAQWQQTLAAAGITSGDPGWLWLMQEASGDPADSIGAGPLTNVGGAMAHQGAVAGWSRKAMYNGFDNGGYTLLNVADPALPDVSAESSLLIGYFTVTTAPGGNRGLLLTGDVRAELTAGLIPFVTSNAQTAMGAQSVTDAVRPWVLRHNVTDSTTALFTDLEKVTCPFAASGASKRTFLGAGFQNAPIYKVLYAAQFKGAKAEIPDAKLRTLLQRLAWSPVW